MEPIGNFFHTDYGFFAFARHTTAKLTDPLCSCKSKETRDHILLHLSRYHRILIKFFQALEMMLRCYRQPPLPEHFYTPGHQKNHYTIAGILELKCLIQIKMVKMPISKHSNRSRGCSKTMDILIAVSAL
jgi:hypothetical protein